MTKTFGPIADLRAALEDLAAALTGARAADLLAIEPRLAAAVAALPTGPPGDAGDRARARDELARARHALKQCRRLGANLQDVVRYSTEWLGAVPQYDGSGQATTGRPASALDVRG